MVWGAGHRDPLMSVCGWGGDSHFRLGSQGRFPELRREGIFVIKRGCEEEPAVADFSPFWAL